jgi:predicted DNA-binding transcriptional regulator YafY
MPRERLPSPTATKTGALRGAPYGRLAYYVDATLIGAWCELRDDFRHFRLDRIADAAVLDERFPADRAKLMAQWLALRKDRPDRPRNEVL